MIVDWPVGTPEERAVATTGLPGAWQNANPYANWYEISPGNYNYHTGADLNLNTPTWNSDWHKPVWAIADGVVIFAGVGGGSWGHIVVVKHTFEDGRFVMSRAGHVEKTLVVTGQRVVRGQQIASVGNGDGRYGQDGAHLHFDISALNDRTMLDRPNHWCYADLACVHSHYVDPIAFILAHKSVQAKGASMYVTSLTGLDVYQYSDHNSKVLAHVLYGDMLAVLPGPQQRGLAHINEPLDGYVSASALSIKQPPAIRKTVARYVTATEGLYVHESPRLDSAHVGKGLAYRARVNVFLDKPGDIVNGFVQIADSGPFKNAWAYDQYLEASDPGPITPPTPAVVVASLPASRSRLGFHVIWGANYDALYDMARTLKLAGITNMKYAGRGDHFNNQKFKDACNGQSVIVNRWYAEQDPLPGPDWRINDLTAAGAAYVRLYYNLYLAKDPDSLVANWHQVMNEPTAYGPGTATFWLGAMQAADALGIKLAIGCFSERFPPLPTEAGGAAFWTRFWDTLRYAKAHGHIYMRHAYVVPDPNGSWTDAPTMLRHRLELVPADLKDMSVWYGEYGTAYGANYDDATYKNGFAAADALLRQDTNVLGVALWTAGGGGGWPQSLIDGKLATLKNYLIGA